MNLRAATARSGLVAGLALTAIALAGCGGDGPTEPMNQVASVRIDVDPSVTIVNGTPTISVGDSADFDATARNGQGQPISTSISWSSLHPSIATVDDTGTAAGLAPGQASIVASAGSGVSDTAILVVQDPGGNPDAPNLVAVSLDLLPRGVLANGTVEARAVVENDGQEAGSYRLTVGEGGTVLAGVDRDGLDAGATDTMVITGLGPFAQGPHELTLRVDTDNEITEGDETDNVFNARLESRAAGYDIELRFVGVSSTLESEVRDEVESWEQVITGDVGDVAVDSLMLDTCFGEGENPGFGVRTQPIDDLLILVRTDSIDGLAGTLARAGPCFIRTSTSDPELPPHPVVGLIEIDAADVDTARTLGILRPLIRHEAAHVLGFGSLWNFQGGTMPPPPDTVGPFQLLEAGGTTDPRFVGPFAIDRYQAIGGDDPDVPVEGRPSGPGTRDSHWRETVFDNELMTGFIGTGANPLSAVTIASLADMFYSVDPSQADPFSLPAGGGAAVRLFGGGAWDLHGDVIFEGPLFGVDADGRVTRIDRRALRPPPGSGGER